MKLRILHLEDDENDAELIRLTLARSGLPCDIRNVNSGSDYLAALQSSDFDVILSDSGIPGYNGLEAMDAARKRCPTVPFIFVSGQIQPEQSGGNPEKRQRRDNRSAAKGIPRSANGATRDAGRGTSGRTEQRGAASREPRLEIESRQAGAGD